MYAYPCICACFYVGLIMYNMCPSVKRKRRVKCRERWSPLSPLVLLQTHDLADRSDFVRPGEFPQVYLSGLPLSPTPALQQTLELTPNAHE